MKKIIALASLTILSLTLYVNFLGGTGSINGISTGEVSGHYPALFTPAGSTFAIWSVIYLLNISFVIIQVVASFKGEGKSDEKLTLFFIAICVLNVGWIFAWHHEQLELSVILMSGLLITLIRTFILAQNTGLPRVAATIVKANFSVYLAWICVATIANLSALLISWGVSHDSITAMVLTLVVISVATFLATWQLIKFKNGWYAAVIIWALYGIYKARIAEFSTMTEYVAWAAQVAMLIVLVTGGYVFTKKFIRLRP
ncbi:MAG: tryptophan-rich sensory protein [Roseivirga sp.]|nr:tryptophan-rich sensory protein [Roseivirga sp.]